jgi:hypothetical protein
MILLSSLLSAYIQTFLTRFLMNLHSELRSKTSRTSNALSPNRIDQKTAAN